MPPADSAVKEMCMGDAVWVPSRFDIARGIMSHPHQINGATAGCLGRERTLTQSLLCCNSLTGVNFKEVNKDNRQKLFGEIYTAIDTLAFTFGNV